MIRDIPYLNPDDLPKVPFVINGISSRFIRENRIVPLDLKNSVLKVVMANPDDTAAVDALRVASAADLVIYTSDNAALEEYISRFYEQESQNINRIIEDMGDKGIEFLGEEHEDVGHLKDLASEAPIIRLVRARWVRMRWQWSIHKRAFTASRICASQTRRSCPRSSAATSTPPPS